MRNELIRFLFFAGRHRRFRTSHSVFIEEKNKQTNNQQQQVSASLCPNKPWQVRIFSNYFTIFVFGHSKDEFWTPAESEALEWDGHRRTRGTRHARRTGNWLLPQCVATWLSVGVSAISTRHILGRLNAVSSRPTKRQFHPTMTRCSRNKAPPRFRRRFSFASAPAISLRACVPDFDSFFLFLSHMLQCNRVPGRFLGFDSVERVETDDDADKSGTISNGRPEIAAKKKKAASQNCALGGVVPVSETTTPTASGQSPGAESRGADAFSFPSFFFFFCFIFRPSSSSLVSLKLG